MFSWKACEMTVRHKAGFALWKEHCATDAAVGFRETIFGILRREKLQDQTFPKTSYSTGALLSGGNEGGMSYLLLAHVAVQPSLDASELLRKWVKISPLQL